MIKLQIIGNLGKDCIVKEVNGKNVINFSVAHSEKFRDAQGVEKERTTWVECAYWIEKTNVSQYLTKGRTVYAEGYPQADAYANKDGQPAATLRMRVTNIQLLSSNNGGGEGGVVQQHESLSSQGNSIEKSSGSPLSSSNSESNQSFESTTSSNTQEASSEKNINTQLSSSVSEVNQSDVKEDAENSGDDLPF